MQKFFVLFIGLIYGQVAFAQNAVVLPGTGLKAAYMGTLIYPGFKIGIERPYKVIQVEKEKRRGTKIVLKERYWTLNLGYYSHPTFHSHVYLLAEWQRRRQKSKGWFFEFTPGVGYSRTFLGGATYTVNDNGDVSKKALAGYNYVQFSLAGGIGYDFSKRLNAPIKAYFKPSLMILTPYNSFIYARPTAELGVIYAPSFFYQSSPKVKIKKK
jgi:hypothetical protein